MKPITKIILMSILIAACLACTRSEIRKAPDFIYMNQPQFEFQ